MLAVVCKTPVFRQINTQKHIAARVPIKSPANDAVVASRSLRHNVPLNVNHDVPRDFSGDAPFTDENNIGFKGCQQINL